MMRPPCFADRPAGPRPHWGLGRFADPDCIAPEKVCVFLMLVASAYMQSISAFVAQNNGAGLPERSVKALFYGIRTAFAAGAGMGALALFGGAQLTRWSLQRPTPI